MYKEQMINDLTRLVAKGVITVDQIVDSEVKERVKGNISKLKG